MSTISERDPRATVLDLSLKQRLNLVPEHCCDVVRSLSFLNVAVYTPELQPLYKPPVRPRQVDFDIL
jgi:hypothetical protein